MTSVFKPLARVLSSSTLVSRALAVVQAWVRVTPGRNQLVVVEIFKNHPSTSTGGKQRNNRTLTGRFVCVLGFDLEERRVVIREVLL